MYEIRNSQYIQTKLSATITNLAILHATFVTQFKLEFVQTEARDAVDARDAEGRFVVSRLVYSEQQEASERLQQQVQNGHTVKQLRKILSEQCGDEVPWLNWTEQ